VIRELKEETGLDSEVNDLIYFRNLSASEKNNYSDLYFVFLVSSSSY
jgi:ADP-ribose pyrophosphatase YjhB (NUDIX family)